MFSIPCTIIALQDEIHRVLTGMKMHHDALMVFFHVCTPLILSRIPTIQRLFTTVHRLKSWSTHVKPMNRYRQVSVALDLQQGEQVYISSMLSLLKRREHILVSGRRLIIKQSHNIGPVSNCFSGHGKSKIPKYWTNLYTLSSRKFFASIPYNCFGPVMQQCSHLCKAVYRIQVNLIRSRILTCYAALRGRELSRISISKQALLQQVYTLWNPRVTGYSESRPGSSRACF